MKHSRHAFLNFRNRLIQHFGITFNPRKFPIFLSYSDLVVLLEKKENVKYQVLFKVYGPFQVLFKTSLVFKDFSR